MEGILVEMKKVGGRAVRESRKSGLMGKKTSGIQ